MTKIILSVTIFVIKMVEMCVPPCVSDHVFIKYIQTLYYQVQT